VVLAVQDEGCTIDPRLLDKIFEPYGAIRKNGGGLGLAIVKRVAEQAGGFAEVLPGTQAGTSFRVHLPRVTHNGL
jgi:C4-dicarboxylate-specific signal transduction histidine kinase